MRFLFIISLFFSLLTGCTGGRAVLRELPVPQTGSWGDQGDGTFRNPILNSNYPDSDVEKFGGKWYMISSKGLYMKGMTVLESEDLVNWEIVGGIVDSITWDTKEGVWAGDLAYHGEKWHCYFIDIDKGLFVCESRDIKGPWSAPELILERRGMTDPTVFWDDETQTAYMLCNYQIDEVDRRRIYHQRLFRMSQDGRTLLDEGKDIYVGVGAEAAKIYKVNGLFYIFISEWSTDAEGRKTDRRQIVLRSRSIEGPFERKVLLERGNGTNRSCCQGALIQAPDGSWWYTHQLVQTRNSYEGRSQFLIPVRWEDGWPLLGLDTDGNGIGNTVWHCRKPIQGKPLKAAQTDDDFNSGELAPHWLWDGNPVSGKWSLTEKKGCLRLYATIPKNTDRKYHTLPNKLVQRKMGKGIDTVTTKMNISAMAEGQSAGLIFMGYNYAAAGIARENGDCRIYTEHRDNTVAGPRITGPWIWLRGCMTQRKGHFEYSTDGKNYYPAGNTFEMETRGFNGIFIGLFSMNPSGLGHVDYDWFSYDYDGPKSKALQF